MARRQRLSKARIAELFDPPAEQRELVRHFRLSPADIAAIDTCAKSGMPTDVTIDKDVLKISPIEKSTPPEAEALAARLCAALPRIRITDLLTEVAGWTLFPDCFTHLRIGRWKYSYPTVDKTGGTVDFLLSAKRARKAALRFLRKAIGQHGVPEKITIDKSGANTASLESYNGEHEAEIEIRQIKYLNNMVEQDPLQSSEWCGQCSVSNRFDRLRQPLPASNSCT